MLRQLSNRAHARFERHASAADKLPPIKIFEGDTVPVYSQIFQMYGQNVTELLISKGILPDVPSPSDTTRIDYHLWPNRVNDVVEVPVEFDESFVGDKSVIRQALVDLEISAGVVRFVPKTTETHFIRVTSKQVDFTWDMPTYCAWSYVGYHPYVLHDGGQEVNVAGECQSSGIIQHEFMHALGMWHTSSRVDRDDYVAVLWKNIHRGLEWEFQKRAVNDTLGLPYDYASTMHNLKDDYSDDSSIILQSIDDSEQPLGQTDRPSHGDIVHMRLLYQCASGPRTYQEYMNDICTTDCKCWERQFGCKANNRACQGDLVCLDNQCVAPQATSTSFVPWTLAVFGGVVLVVCLWVLCVRRRGSKRNYQSI